MNLLFMDVETTGLNPNVHEVIEICLVETLPDGTIVQRFDSKIKPRGPVDPKAAEVNGYTPEKWATAPPDYEVWGKINDVFGKCTCMSRVGANDLVEHQEWCRAHPKNKLTPWGWNVGFDLSFIKSHVFSEMSYHPEDVRSLCRPFLPWDKKVSLSDAVRFLLEREHAFAHTAVGDVMAYIELYKLVIATWKTLGEEQKRRHDTNRLAVKAVERWGSGLADSKAC